MSTDNKLQLAIHLALGISTGALALSVSPGVAAQEADEEGDELLMEEVLITGSRIKRADIDSASPVTILDRDTMVATGLTDVGKIGRASCRERV